jgi:hypothetical protein
MALLYSQPKFGDSANRSKIFDIVNDAFNFNRINRINIRHNSDQQMRWRTCVVTLSDTSQSGCNCYFYCVQFVHEEAAY